MTSESQQEPHGPSHGPGTSRGLVVALVVLAAVAVGSLAALTTMALRGTPTDDRVRAVATPNPEATSGPATPTRSASATPPAGRATPVPTRARPTGRLAVPEPASTDVIVTQWYDIGRLPPSDVTPAEQCLQSSTVQRPDALRCFTPDSRVLDPCFEIEGSRLACPEAPWSQRYVKISTQGELGAVPPATAEGRPWGVELEDGRRCHFLSGASTEAEGKRANYACDDDGILYGDPERGEPWHMWLGEREDASPLERVAVAVAWF